MNVFQGLKSLFIGRSRDLSDRALFSKVSLVALLAWVGMGADGMSSACYGPESAFLALKGHPCLSVFVAIATVFTIAVICAGYSQIVELFPSGGGGYLVASKLLSPSAGVVSGCALIIDYVLTIAISISSGADAIFSLAPESWQHAKLSFALAGVVLLTLMNMRGVKESVLPFVPVFILFVATHFFAILYGFFAHLSDFSSLAGATVAELRVTHSTLGFAGMFMLVMRAYSLGAGTFTGIEAVSNGMPILREPRVETGKRTMLYMGVSLATTVAGLLVLYLLYRVEPEAGKTLNAVVFQRIAAEWPGKLGFAFVMAAMFSEAALLFVAAQAGFLDGPRVLSNMAQDRWFPTRFTSLSDRFVTQNGLLLMGGAALFVVFLSRGSVAYLVVLYSINVFITFTLSQLGMALHWLKYRSSVPTWRRKLAINGVGFVLTSFILVSLSLMKFREGGWITLLVTGLLTAVAFLVKSHYRKTAGELRRLDELVSAAELDIPVATKGKGAEAKPAFDPKAKTAVVLVSGFNGLGLHTLFGILRMFPGVFKNFIFIEVGVVDAGNFKGAREIESLREHVRLEVDRYVNYMGRKGYYAEGEMALGTDIVASSEVIAQTALKRFPQAVFFGGQLVFPHESWVNRFLHNYVVFALQRRFYRQGIPFLILPIRV